MGPSRTFEEMKHDMEKPLEGREKDLHQRYLDKYSRIEEKLHLRAQEEYCNKMKDKGLRVEFARDKAIEGYYIKAEEIDGRKYAVIESQGVRFMVSYDKQYDQMQKHRYVVYDGQKMAYAQQKNLERNLAQDLGRNKGPGFER